MPVALDPSGGLIAQGQLRLKAIDSFQTGPVNLSKELLNPQRCIFVLLLQRKGEGGGHAQL